MIRRVALLGVLMTVIGTAFAWSQQSQTVRPAAQAVQQIITDSYISGFRSTVGLTEEQFLNVAVALRQGINQRFMNAQQVDMLRRRLEQMIDQNPSDQEVELITQQLEQAERRAQNNERMFLARIDPELSNIQKLLARKYHQEFAQDLRQKIERAVQAIQAQQQKQQQNRPAQQRPGQNRGQVPQTEFKTR